MLISKQHNATVLISISLIHNMKNLKTATKNRTGLTLLLSINMTRNRFFAYTITN